MLKGFEEIAIIILMLLWTLPWKGVALWRAANRGEKKWFVALLILNTLALLDILYIFVFSKRSARVAEELTQKEKKDDPLAKARKARQDKKYAAKQKILESLSQRGQISNADIEILLNISDATATRYLNELEKEGRVQQKGKVGRGVFYVLK